MQENQDQNSTLSSLTNFIKNDYILNKSKYISSEFANFSDTFY